MNFPIPDVVKNFRYIMDSIKRATGNIKKHGDDNSKGMPMAITLHFPPLTLSYSYAYNEGDPQFEECTGDCHIGLLEHLRVVMQYNTLKLCHKKGVRNKNSTCRLIGLPLHALVVYGFSYPSGSFFFFLFSFFFKVASDMSIVDPFDNALSSSFTDIGASY
jgi:hypothetical protein